MSEWLGTGLQNRLHQFESGWHLKMKKISFSCNSAEVIFFFFAITFANYNKLVYLCDIVDSVNLRIMKKLGQAENPVHMLN